MKHLHLKASLTVLLACLIFSSMKCKKEAEIQFAQLKVLYETVKALGIDYTPSDLQINDDFFAGGEMTTKSTDVYNYKFTVRAKSSSLSGLDFYEYSGTFPGSMLKIGKDQLNNLKITVENRGGVLYVNGVKTDTAPFSPKGKLPEGPTGNPVAGDCPEGTWKVATCSVASNKFLIYNFGPRNSSGFGDGYASNPDCNNICTPMIFRFKYSISGNKITYNFTSTDNVTCGGTSSKPSVPSGTYSITYTCGNNGNQLVTQASNIQTGVITTTTFTRQ